MLHPRSSHPLKFDHPGNIWWNVQIMKLLINSILHPPARLFATTSRLALGPTQPPIKSVPGFFNCWSGVKSTGFPRVEKVRIQTQFLWNVCFWERTSPWEIYNVSVTSNASQCVTASVVLFCRLQVDTTEYDDKQTLPTYASGLQTFLITHPYISKNNVSHIPNISTYKFIYL
jgi:hypothetical protein